jgi:hypothetical protein
VIAMITVILIAALVAVIVVTAHEMTEHGDPEFEPPPVRPGADGQWGELVAAMRRLRKHRARERRRG